LIQGEKYWFFDFINGLYLGLAETEWLYQSDVLAGFGQAGDVE